MTGIYIAGCLYMIGIFAFLYASTILYLQISLELIQLSIGLFFVNYAFQLDDGVASQFTLFILALAGAESALAQGQIVAYYPQRRTLNLNDGQSPY